MLYHYDRITVFDLSKPLHIEKNIHGVFVIGKGCMCPCKNQYEAEMLIERLTVGLTFKERKV